MQVNGWSEMTLPQCGSPITLLKYRMVSTIAVAFPFNAVLEFKPQSKLEVTV